MNGESVICPYCEQPAELVNGAVIFAHRSDLAWKQFWRCEPCMAHVGCHPPASASGKAGIGDGTIPLGNLSNPELRRAKHAAHAAFDPIWKSGEMKRTKAYSWLSKQLDIHKDDCHIGMFSLSQCRAVVELCATRQTRV